MIPATDLAAMVRRAEAASPGPWLNHEEQKFGVLICAVAPGPQHRCYSDAASGTFPASDLRFIKHSRTDLPALAAALSEAMAALKHANPTNHGYSEDCKDCAAARALLATFYGEGK